MVAQRTSQLPTTFEVSADRLPLCCSPGVYKVVDDLDATARAATYLNGRLVASLKRPFFVMINSAGVGRMVMSKKTFTSEKPLTAEGPAAKTAYVVLVVEGELTERASTATHLRKSGFDVIEAADGDEARRVLDSVSVNVVFADLAMPGQTNGLALLRWLRERHPGIKTIVTSGTETNLAALDGYGTFLSKPYRLVDLDYCLQKVLATASIPDNETGGAVTADPATKTNPAPGKAQPGNASPNRPPARGKADRRGDEISDPSMAELSRRLAERAARQRAVDPGAAKAAHRAALQAYDRARARRQRLALAFAVAAIASSGIAYLFPTVGSEAVPPSPSAAARPDPA
jgi:CheY-like chemotaxis protein